MQIQHCSKNHVHHWLNERQYICYTIWTNDHIEMYVVTGKGHKDIYRKDIYHEVLK